MPLFFKLSRTAIFLTRIICLITAGIIIGESTSEIPTASQQEISRKISSISSPAAPVAFNVNANIYTFETSTIALQAMDDGQPDPPGQLSYIIISLPDNAVLQDPCSGSGIIDGNMLPYTLSFYGSTIWFAAETNNLRTFQYRVYDGETQSNIATVTVEMLPHLLNALSFDEQGIVEFNDNNFYRYQQWMGG